MFQTRATIVIPDFDSLAFCDYLKELGTHLHCVTSDDKEVLITRRRVERMSRYDEYMDVMKNLHRTQRAVDEKIIPHYRANGGHENSEEYQYLKKVKDRLASSESDLLYIIKHIEVEE